MRDNVFSLVLHAVKELNQIFYSVSIDHGVVNKS